MKKALRIKLLISIIILFSSIFGYSAATYLKQFDFNDTSALDKWGRMVLNGQVNYRLIKYKGEGCVDALSKMACSALYYRIGYKIQDYPVLTWKWHVVKFPDKTKATTEKEKDDYAARVYVIFPFLNFSSSKFIEYVWAEELPAGAILNSPEGKNIKIIVVRNDKPKEGELVSENRNVYEDYIKAFGTKPSRPAGAIAIMCDADSTKTSAESMFGDIAIAK